MEYIFFKYNNNVENMKWVSESKHIKGFDGQLDIKEQKAL